MPETEEDFFQEYPFLKPFRPEVDSKYKALSRRKEILSEKIILHKLFPNDDVVMSHNADGRPVLSNGMDISISHTRNYIAMMVSATRRVALDIEHISDRVKKVGRMYLRDDEHFTEISEMLVAWCVKETMYKLFSSQNLTFQEIHVHGFQLENGGIVLADNLRTGENVSLEYSITDEYVLTTTSL